MMFTGLIRQVGTIHSARSFGKGKKIEVICRENLHSSTGDSISVNGVCLTLERRRGLKFEFSLSPETVNRSHPGKWQIGVFANLEPALRVGDPLGGHFVQGHVDGIGEVRSITGRPFHTLEILLPPDLLKYVALKGSISIDGVSLTIADLQGLVVRIALVPATVSNTTLLHLRPGNPVHVETDILAKYVERLIRHENL